MPYKTDERVEKLAATLIEKYHPHLVNAKIAYLMHTTPMPAKAPRLGKKRKLGCAGLVPEKYNSLTGFDFIIEIKKDQWDRMDLETQEALLDHELCHCGVDGDGPYIKDHDVTEFSQIIERHGFWLHDLRRFYETSAAIAQGELFPEPAAATRPLPGVPTIEINVDRPCDVCGKKGDTTQNGVCLKCLVKRLKVKDRKEAGEKTSVH